MITLLIVYGLNNALVAAVSGWLWHAKGWQSGYHEGAHDGVRQIMAQRPIKRPVEPAEPGGGVGLSTTPGDAPRGAGGPPWRVEAGGDQSPVLGLRRDRASYAADHPVRSILGPQNRCAPR